MTRIWSFAGTPHPSSRFGCRPGSRRSLASRSVFISIPTSITTIVSARLRYFAGRSGSDRRCACGPLPPLFAMRRCCTFTTGKLRARGCPTLPPSCSPQCRPTGGRARSARTSAASPKRPRRSSPADIARCSDHHRAVSSTARQRQCGRLRAVGFRPPAHAELRR